MRFATGNRKGQTAIMFTLAAVPLFGILGLVVDVGWAYYRKQAAQTAADAAAGAAGAAAYDWGGGAGTCTSSTHIKCYADEHLCPANPSTTPTDNVETGCLYAKQNGFSNAVGGRQKVTIQSGVGAAPTSTGVTITYWMVVRVSETIPQLFSAVLGFPQATVTARASTGNRPASGGGCVLVMNPNAANALSLSGTPSLTSGCGVFVNSNSSTAVNLNGSAQITTTGTAKTQIVGNCSGCSNISPAPQTGVGQTSDPFADMAPPTEGACNSTGVSLGSHDHLTITPGVNPYVICGSGISLGAQSTLTLNPGVYIVDSSSGINLGAQTTMSGTGVTIYIKQGGVSMSGGATVNLTAPTSGAWQGILFYQDRADTTASTLVGGTGQLMNGVLYFPKANLTYTGGSSTSATATTIVADTLTMVGNSFIQASATTQFTGVTGGSFLIE
jgi:hypothetical protein